VDSTRSPGMFSLIRDKGGSSQFQALRRNAGLLLFISLWMGMTAFTAWAQGRLLPLKEQEVTQFGDLQIPALDQENWKYPQSMFSWIAMACHWRVPDDKYGRPGWFANARILPVNPGVTEFPLTQPAVYVVFEIPALDAPMQMNADWFVLDDNGKPTGKAIGNDAQLMDMNEGYGYLEVRQPDGGWKPGAYLVKIYISSPGQQIHALSQVGTMRFVISGSEQAVRACPDDSPR